MDLRVPVPTIDIAVSMRCLSEIKDQRKSASQFMPGPEIQVEDRKEDFVRKLKNGLYAATIVTYAQGLSLLRRASDSRKYNLNMEAVARIWRGGCIIRAALLEDLRDAFQEKPDLPNLLLDPRLGRDVLSRLPDWRTVVSKAAEWGIPTPGLMVSLAYFDAYRSERLPANLTQAQRDYFGAHTYERVDAEGTFHTEWNQDQEDL